MSQFELDGIEALLKSRPYRALRALGRGGMSEVYLVEHEFLGRQFVLKVLKAKFATDPLYIERLRIEARALARLNHPNIVEVVDLWCAEGGSPCVVMELLGGVTLADELAKRKRLPASEAVELTCQALSALGAGHAEGIVHRDIKPENLFLQDIAQGRILKVLDYGLARVMPSTPWQGLQPSIPTESGTLVGSPRFMSPEARKGERVDHRADLYAAGLVLYVMLAGRGPFDSGETLEPPSRYTPSKVADELDQVVMRAIQEIPEKRFQSAEEFLAALDAV